MAKTIKFNLILDNYPVRTLEDLREHFSIEDILHYFSNGLLLRWLSVRGYKAQFDAVSGVDAGIGTQNIIMELIRIFEIESKEEDIRKGIAILQYLDEERELYALYREHSCSRDQIIDDYHTGYECLIRHMEEFCNDMAILKADALQLERAYSALFALDYSALYFRLEKSSPKAVYAILMRETLCDYWIGNSGPSEEERERIYSSIQYNLLPEEKIKSILGDDLKIVNRNTQAMWDPIERPEVRVMVISIDYGTFVKNAGAFSEKLSAEDINAKFVKLNGLEYQCNDDRRELMYVEI